MDSSARGSERNQAAIIVCSSTTTTAMGPSMARTLMSHGSRPKDLSDGRIAQMARQCHLSKQQFLALIECTLTRESYERHLRKAATSS